MFEYFLAVLELVFIRHIDVLTAWYELHIFVFIEVLRGKYKGRVEYTTIILQRVDKTIV